MASHKCATATPSLVYEESTGYLVLTDGSLRQVIARTDGKNLYLLWKKTRPKLERSVTLEDLAALMDKARGN